MKQKRENKILKINQNQIKFANNEENLQKSQIQRISQLSFKRNSQPSSQCSTPQTTASKAKPTPKNGFSNVYNEVQSVLATTYKISLNQGPQIQRAR